jgi:hypothetical protein
LKNIAIDPANPAYVMKDGKLMTKDDKECFANTTATIHCNKLRILFMKSIN